MGGLVPRLRSFSFGRRVPARDPSPKEVAMSRRSTPERLDAARRAAALARLISDGELPERAEAALARWERRRSRAAASATAGSGRQDTAGSET